jgi:hypothetical protein
MSTAKGLALNTLSDTPQLESVLEDIQQALIKAIEVDVKVKQLVQRCKKHNAARS